MTVIIALIYEKNLVFPQKYVIFSLLTVIPGLFIVTCIQHEYNMRFKKIMRNSNGFARSKSSKFNNKNIYSNSNA